MQSRVVGTTLPVLEFVLEPNESVVSEAGELSWMSVPSSWRPTPSSEEEADSSAR